MSTTRQIAIKANFTKSWFKFPIALYLDKDLRSNNKMYEDLGIPIQDEEVPEGAIGMVECHPEDIMYIHDSFSRPRTIQEVNKDGFDNTCVIMKSGEMFNCVWDRKTFKEKLNSHMEKAEEDNRESIKNQITEAMRGYEMEEMHPTEYKQPWWKFWKK